MLPNVGRKIPLVLERGVNHHLSRMRYWLIMLQDINNAGYSPVAQVKEYWTVVEDLRYVTVIDLHTRNLIPELRNMEKS